MNLRGDVFPLSKGTPRPMMGRRIRRPGGEVATRKAASRHGSTPVVRACRAALCAARYSSSAGIPMKAEGRERPPTCRAPGHPGARGGRSRPGAGGGTRRSIDRVQPVARASLFGCALGPVQERHRACSHRPTTGFQRCPGPGRPVVTAAQSQPPWPPHRRVLSRARRRQGASLRSAPAHGPHGASGP